MKFIHTADWQIGKPFARIRDANKRALVQQARIDAIKRIGVIAGDCKAEFVLVAGDLFDSTTPDKATVSAACSAIGQMKIPVYVIPGNHDHGGPGCLWQQDFFLRERDGLASNLHLLLKPEPIHLDSAVLLPCPLWRRSVSGDPTDWLRSQEQYNDLPSGKPRIVLAHGSTQAFSGQWEDDEESSLFSNLINLDRLPGEEIDYVALGDWHGTKQVDKKAWYAGTPEIDRFPRGEDNDPGNILIVEVGRGSAPQVLRKKTGSLNWIELAFEFPDDTAIKVLKDDLASLLEGRTVESLLKLTLTGSLGIEASNQLEIFLESQESRLLRLKLANHTSVTPTEQEIEDLTRRSADPLISSVAERLLERSNSDNGDAEIARIALRELHAACLKEVLS